MFYKAMLKKKNNKRAFTLIELIVVIAIIGVLIAILVPTMNGLVDDARTQTNLANARTGYSIAVAEATFMKNTNTPYDEASLATEVAAQIVDVKGSFAITLDASNNVTAVTYNPPAGSGLAQTYPIPAAPAS